MFSLDYSSAYVLKVFTAVKSFLNLQNHKTLPNSTLNVLKSIQISYNNKAMSPCLYDLQKKKGEGRIHKYVTLNFHILTFLNLWHNSIYIPWEVMMHLILY